MGLDDRDYMRDVPIYRDLVGRGGGIPPSFTATTGGYAAAPPPARRAQARSRTRARTRPWAWFLLGAIAVLSLVAFGAGRLHSAPQPTAFVPQPALAPSPPPVVRQPRVPPVRTFQLNGPTHVVAGTFMIASGTLPPNVDGVVVVQARWRPGPWFTLATTSSVHGGYRVRYQLARPGTVDIRLALPDGDYAAGVVTVTASAAAPST